MKSLLIGFVVLFSSLSWAGWGEDFQALKSVPRSYEDHGAICEEIARLQFERKYNNSNYDVIVGIAYGDNSRTIGELDIVVMNRQKNQVEHLAEVKCWKNMPGGLKKARDQRSRFLNHIRSNKPVYLESTSTQETFDAQQFKNVSLFTTLGQKGTVNAGYDDELEYTLSELHGFRMEMIECQNRGECASAD